MAISQERTIAIGVPDHKTEKGITVMKPILLCMLLLAVVPWMRAQQPTSAPPQKSISNYLGVHAFPAKNQAPAKQQQDELACYNWATHDTGFDPMAALIARQSSAPTTPPPSPPPPTSGAGVKGAAAGAATGAVVGAIAGDAAKGAGAGAAVGAIGGRARARRAQRQAQEQAKQQQQQQAQAKAETQEKLDSFKKGFGACMEGKGYVVK